jgi:replicative DNA helicase
VPAGVRETYAQKVRALQELCPGRADGEEYEPHELRLSPEAECRRLEFEGRLEPRLDPTADLGHIADWAGKLAGQVLRIAGILHMADHAGEPAPWDKPIAGETMRRAIAIGHYLIPHALAAFGLMGADPFVAEARHILTWLRRTGREEFTRRELFEATKGRFKTVSALELPLDLLVRHGYVRERPADERSGPGRKPAPTFEVNPQIRSHNSRNSHYSSSGPAVGLQDRVSANSANCATGPACEAPAPAPASPAEEVEYEEGIV